MARKPPSAPPRHSQSHQQSNQHQPHQAHPTTNSRPTVLNIFRESTPLRHRRLSQSALPTALLEPLQPYVFLQAEYSQITANKPTPNDASGQFREIPRLQCANMLCRDLRRGADGLHRHPPPFALPSQLLAEFRQSALSHHTSSQTLTNQYNKRLHPAKSKKFR